VNSPHVASSGLDALVCGYSPRLREEKLLAIMYQAFSDDSMGGEGEKTLLLAACVQKYPAWADFAFSWEAALVKQPSIKYFKMREARGLIGEFQGWRPTTRDRKIELLSRVIADYDVKTISAWVSRREFWEVVTPIIPYQIRHPYGFLFYAIIIKLAHWQHRAGMTLPVDFVFDEQGSIGAETVVWYQAIKSWQPPHIRALMGSTPIFRDDKMILPLQAADIVAWHTRRLKDNPQDKPETMPTGILSSLSRAEIPISREFLEIMARDMRDVPGVE